MLTADGRTEVTDAVAAGLVFSLTFSSSLMKSEQ